MSSYVFVIVFDGIFSTFRAVFLLMFYTILVILHTTFTLLFFPFAAFVSAFFRECSVTCAQQPSIWRSLLKREEKGGLRVRCLDRLCEQLCIFLHRVFRCMATPLQSTTVCLHLRGRVVTCNVGH